MSPAVTTGKSPPQQKDPFERDRARMARYTELRDFYDGTQWLGKRRRGETRLVVNYGRALVRKVVSYALPDPVGFEVPPPVLSGSGVGSRESSEGAHDSRLTTHDSASEAQANSVETLLSELLAE